MDEAAQRERQPRHLVADVPRSLDELAATANREHALCEANVRAALKHAVAAGEALRLAQVSVPSGDWVAWLAANFASTRRTASTYMRLAAYRDTIPADASTLTIARAAIADLPPLRRGPAHGAPEKVTEARALKAAGVATAEIARRLEANKSTVWMWLNPQRHAQNKVNARKRNREAREALAVQERERAIRAAVRKAGAALSEAYSMSARMAKVLAQAEAEASTDEARAALADATGHYHRMSDAITRALGVES